MFVGEVVAISIIQEEFEVMRVSSIISHLKVKRS